ncbi:MAG: HAD family hydrolase [Lachnospiraceae bacterium]|nr:HAD family hydrolase [Lachnospiraceae bacterium]
MNYRLLCIDLDGTLLTDDKKMKKQDIDALRKAADEGIKIALVTGRMPAATDAIVRQLGIPCILACNAGTYILEKGQCIHAEYLSAKTMNRVYDKVASFGIPLWIFRDKKWYVTEKDKFVKAEEELIQYTAELVSMKELVLKWEEEGIGPNKVLIGTEPSLVQQIHGMLKKQEDVDMACSSPNYLEIFPKGMNKGKALRLICEKMNIKKEETIAFGDQELDIPMLEEAGTAIAMGNAIEELKSKADFITKTNNEAGIAYALSFYVNKEMEDK